MNRTVFILACVMLASPGWAASTCRERVDGNLDKSTPQKVALCLTEPQEAAAGADGPKVIYSNVQTNTPKKKNVWMKKEAHKIYKDKGPVNSEYVERSSFAPFVNDTPSSADLLEAGDRAKEALSYGHEAAAVSAKRTEKPARKLKSARKPAAQKAEPVPPSAPEVPSVQAREASALENNPLAENGDSFTEDDLLTEESFGFNATDPALQP